MNRCIFTWGVLSILPMAGPALAEDARSQASVSIEAEQSALLKAEADFSKLCGEKGIVESFLYYLSDDATIFPVNGNATTGREAIRAQLSRGGKGQLSWRATRAEVSRSGDLGYTFGTYEFKTVGENGKPEIHYGKYVSIWKKGADGRWKVVVDIGNSSPGPSDPH